MTIVVQSGVLRSAVVPTTTWNPSDKAAGATLSGGNLTVVSSITDYTCARSVASHSTGKYYYEALSIGSISTGDMSVFVGVGNGSQSLVVLPGQTTNGMVVLNDGRLLYNNGDLGGPGGGSWANGVLLGIAIDLSGLLVWTRKDGGNWNNNVSADPATGTLGHSFSSLGTAYAFGGAAGFTSGSPGWTANFGATAYANTAPSGFGNW